MLLVKCHHVRCNVNAQQYVAFRSCDLPVGFTGDLNKHQWSNGANKKRRLSDPRNVCEVKTGRQYQGDVAWVKVRIFLGYTQAHKKGNVKEAQPGTVTPRQSAALQLFACRNKKNLKWAVADWLCPTVTLQTHHTSLMWQRRPPGVGHASSPNYFQLSQKLETITDTLTTDVLLSTVLCVLPSSIPCSCLLASLTSVLFTNELPGCCRSLPTILTDFCTTCSDETTSRAPGVRTNNSNGWLQRVAEHLSKLKILVKRTNCCYHCL